MIKTIGITLGLCGLTASMAFGLSMAHGQLKGDALLTADAAPLVPQVAVEQTAALTVPAQSQFDVVADTSVVLASAAPAMADLALPDVADIAVDPAPAATPVSLSANLEVFDTPAAVRPVARSQAQDSPEYDLATLQIPAQPVYKSSTISQPAQSAPLAITTAVIANPDKLKIRSLIGVYR